MTAITQSVRLDRRGRIAVLPVNNPPVNALSQHVRQGLYDGVTQATADAAVGAVVVTCAGRTFIAGADITEFGKPPKEPGLHEVLALIEQNPKPFIAAVHGTALGGGLEVALACHYRIGVKTARFGLPEVKLGLLPGAGGTQRLPRVVGVETALQMSVSGEPIGADAALTHGLIDAIVEGDLTAAGVAFAEKVVSERQPLKKIRDLEDKLAQARGTPELFANFRKSVARQTRGFRAPENCIRAIEAAVTLPFDAGLTRERELFLELLHSPESKAQRYFFFAEREAAKIPDVPPDTPAKEIRKAAVLGAGTMGGGIAMNFANVGIPVTVVEVAREPLECGLGVVRKNYEATASKGRLTPADVDRRLGLIRGTTDFGEIADADIVVEAVFEEMPIKKEVFARIDKICYDFGCPMGPFAMGDLAGLDVGWRIRKGKGLKSPVADRLCEMGRFGQKTGAGYYRYAGSDRTPIPDAEVEKIILGVAREAGIQPRAISDAEILERLLYPMVNEGAKILEEKLAIRASDIDVIWVYGYGWPVYRGGPMVWADQVGLKTLKTRMLELERQYGAVWQLARLLVPMADAGKGFLDQ